MCACLVPNQKNTNWCTHSLSWMTSFLGDSFYNKSLAWFVHPTYTYINFLNGLWTRSTLYGPQHVTAHGTLYQTFGIHGSTEHRHSTHKFISYSRIIISTTWCLVHMCFVLFISTPVAMNCVLLSAYYQSFYLRTTELYSVWAKENLQH